ncbi:hypothetical protein C789_123 [Microcystis aeruginosa FACHB-905 = DIANCHI905]|uniref:Uncharacterized protein n=1 Tax=Microcystis aeruginosa PCC 7806SL TaxID=1903187 RepID=A0AB33C0U4_MICA7|nr:hypothetical protein BH695_4874 [Microcystis aeruginosa PCC 7806SL]ELS50077.1 hypothetical protein C789_123 [Microcystis aeruginosa FACHB-905 = DIANCHI905]
MKFFLSSKPDRFCQVGDRRFNYVYRIIGVSAILILRFHDIKTLAPRGVNNS